MAAPLAVSDSGGNGPVVVLLHAFPLDGRMWRPQFEGLAEQARLVAPDLPGFGRSGPLADSEACSVDTFADAVAGVIEDLGTGPVVLGGLSMGGYVTFALLRRRRDLVGALVLADTRAEPDTDERREQRSAQQRQVQADGTGPLADTMTRTLLGETTRQQRPGVVAEARKLMDQPAAGVVCALEAMKRRPDSTPDLAGIDVPTLVVCGEEDGVSPPEVVRDMAAAISGSQLVVLAGAGHLSNLEAPDAFNAALSGFLATV